jgi:hypothetical protein
MSFFSHFCSERRMDIALPRFWVAIARPAGPRQFGNMLLSMRHHEHTRTGTLVLLRPGAGLVQFEDLASI